MGDEEQSSTKEESGVVVVQAAFQQYSIGIAFGNIADNITRFFLGSDPDLVHRLLVEFFAIGVNAVGIHCLIKYFRRNQGKDERIMMFPFVIGLTNHQPRLTQNSAQIVTELSREAKKLIEKTTGFHLNLGDENNE